MHFVGKKVVIRAIERSDLTALAALHNDPELGANLEFSWPISLASQEKFFERLDTNPNTKRFAVHHPEEGIVGYTGLWGIDWIDRRATEGIIIDKRFHGRGFATDALMTLQRAAFEQIGLHRIDAMIYEFNTVSLKLHIDRCGFKEEGRRREHIFRNGRWWDTVMVGVLAADYNEFSKASRYWE